MQEPHSCAAIFTVVKYLKKLAAAWDSAEQVLLALLVILMVVLAALQIILRDFFGTGIFGADLILGMALLWLTMIGGLVATGAAKHINIDLISPFVPGRIQHVVRAVTNLFAALVCSILARAGWHYVLLQKEMGTADICGIPTWVYYMVVPACFALMALRFVLLAGIEILDVARPNAKSAEGPPA